jgi:hypothetical protein
MRSAGRSKAISAKGIKSDEPDQQTADKKRME